MDTHNEWEKYRDEVKERLFVLYPQIAGAMHLETFDMLFIEPAQQLVIALLTFHTAALRKEWAGKIAQIETTFGVTGSDNYQIGQNHGRQEFKRKVLALIEPDSSN